MKADVVIVNLDSGPELVDALRSVDGPDVHLVVVDNASTDGSLDAVEAAFPDATIVRNDTNRGFGPAVNQGAKAGRAPVIVLVNPDATAAPGAVDRLVATVEERAAAGAVGALVRNPDGSVQPSKRAFPSLWQSALHGLVGLVTSNNPGTRAYLLLDAPVDRPCRVGWVSCSAAAYRREAFEAVGGFDEDFFFFVEDVDLCKRLADAGWEVWFEPRAEVTHAWGGSWTRKPLKFLWMHQRNLFRYVTKHRRGAWVLAWPAIAAGLLLRFVLLAVRWLVVRRSVPAHRRTS